MKRTEEIMHSAAFALRAAANLKLRAFWGDLRMISVHPDSMLKGLNAVILSPRVLDLTY